MITAGITGLAIYLFLQYTEAQETSRFLLDVMNPRVDRFIRNSEKVLAELEALRTPTGSENELWENIREADRLMLELAAREAERQLLAKGRK